ncbi:nicotinate-nicotinamide nucleotide adenylyltransferase [Aliiglaciecola sp. M165]|uniref:nicotinate-nicotinamide nucleotide adenylyltransferase n=1 Tax=Aliiglaciecola sp. M165 TaxID=2593649 RepID=UPI00118002C9|nr:nicotinate-nicotinamide nucleotide adenylyltransferase [Aliiglaciecola sp. M165]TRY29891.1 nicotinate-nicotinamide nucleotide adenylyltransferase [Aliiglaciecola sp. M165]
MRVAIFGSAFNPPTRGHLDALHYLLESTNVDKILLVPSFAHAFGKDMLEYDTRLALLDEFQRDINLSQVEVFAIEHTLSDGSKPVYTYDLLQHLQNNQLKEHQLFFVIGPDNLKNWHKFYQADNILKQWGRIVVPERVAVRSTAVREAITAGKPLDQLVTNGVAKFIAANHLYQ